MTIEFKEAIFGKETDIIFRVRKIVIHVMDQVLNQERSQKHVRSVKAAGSRKSYRIRRLAVLLTAVHVRLVVAQAKSSKKNAELVMARVK